MPLRDSYASAFQKAEAFCLLEKEEKEREEFSRLKVIKAQKLKKEEEEEIFQEIQDLQNDPIIQQEIQEERQTEKDPPETSSK